MDLEKFGIVETTPENLKPRDKTKRQELDAVKQRTVASLRERVEARSIVYPELAEERRIWQERKYAFLEAFKRLCKEYHITLEISEWASLIEYSEEHMESVWKELE